MWADYSGKGIKVVVLDDGVQASHPDLKANIDLSLCYNFSRDRPSGNPVGADDNHGTSVAGIIAAAANGVGGVGVAFGATLGGVIGDTLEETAWGFDFAVDGGAHVVNNSWGFDPFHDDIYDQDSEAAGVFDSLLHAVSAGRGGLGTVLTFAAGNEREEGYDANTNAINSSPYGIAVAAGNADGTITSYSTPGASVLITAPVGEGTAASPALTTTDRTGSNGYVSGDYFTTKDDGFNGTSAATPVISGVVALMLQANPGLGYRDVQEILAYSARVGDLEDADWLVNGAGNWNGGGLYASRDFGFGYVNTHAAVRLAETWDAQSTYANLKTVTESSGRMTLAVPDNRAAGVSSRLHVDEDLRLDHVAVTVQLAPKQLTASYMNAAYGQLTLELTSPDGTVSTLLDCTKAKPGSTYTWTYVSTQFWGESSRGDWSLHLVDTKSGYTLALRDWSLKLFGDTASSNDRYVFTDDYAYCTGAENASRRLLTDTQGTDRINAAAVTSATVLDLRAGATSTIADNQLKLAATTLIENACTGDANDKITGNDAANTLGGGRGNDTLSGGAGNDTLDGGAGNDLLIGGSGTERLSGGSGNDLFRFGAWADLGLGATRDAISDFARGQDKIDLSLIDANAAKAGDQAFSFVTSDFGKVAGQIKYAGGIVSINTDTDAAAEYEIALLGKAPTALSAADFVL